ncbi:Glutathione S-transferase [Bosea sp. LC85]|uniref:glutathione S-transferase family protein n=1 Tax=Bosea sp. LC85 TaxID=1502851 RepID=UPI0004E29AFF|nr:glutathione S-transferase [Bosea sp. LC85]KFC63930.1 Glutathione S-transferase [Bosea sp. LC85]
MKLYDGGRAPNPRRVRIFFAEKGVPLPELVPVDIARKEHLTPEFARINPLKRLPVLMLDDGTALAETIAICRYLEGLHPQPVLFGGDAKEQAQIEMWNRRVELGLFTSIMSVFRHGHPSMAELEHQVPEWAEASREQIDDHLLIMELQLAGNRFLSGDQFTVADITAGIAVDFMKPSRVRLPEEYVNIRRWHAEVSGRPSWKA